MSTHAHTKSRKSTPEVSIWLSSPRELSHAEENHKGHVSDCGPCDRFELAECNGYVDGLASWFEFVGQFIDSVNETICAVVAR